MFLNIFYCIFYKFTIIFFNHNIFNLFLKTKKKGLVTSMYLIYYGVGRTLIEGLRTDSLWTKIFGIDFL